MKTLNVLLLCSTYALVNLYKPPSLTHRYQLKPLKGWDAYRTARIFDSHTGTLYYRAVPSLAERSKLGSLIEIKLEEPEVENGLTPEEEAELAQLKAEGFVPPASDELTPEERLAEIEAEEAAEAAAATAQQAVLSPEERLAKQRKRQRQH